MLFLLQGQKMIVKKLTEKLNKIKICAVFTAACFVISTLGANLYAIPMSENTNKKYEDVFNKPSSISNEYGKITSSKDAKSDITVINIQDLHCHPQTQKNISKLIKEIADKYNLKNIYVEGGYGDIDTTWLNSIKDENIRKQAIEKLLEEGILTGSEYFKLTNNNKIELKGIDEEKIHKDNVKRLAWLITQQDKYKEITEKVTKEIGILENIYVNSRNKKFSESIEEYLNNKTDTKKFYKKLIKYVKDINNNPQKYNNITAIRLEEYPNITKFLSMATDSHEINVKKVKTELQELIVLLKNKLPFGVYSQLLKETNNFTDNQKSLELINLLCEKENIDLNKDFKEVVKLSNLNLNNNGFNPVQLVQEERQLISEIRKALSYNNEEYEITFVSDFKSFFKSYLEYKLTDADWKYFESCYNQFRQFYAKYATVDRIKDIEQDFAEINKYYSINDQRNNIFVEKLLEHKDINFIISNKERTDEEILKNSKEIIIAVTGGFHSSRLEEMLSKKEVNTIVITPTVYGNTEQANEKYVDLIEKQSNFNSQALAYTLASCTTDINKQKLLLSILKDVAGKNIQELEKILGKKIDLSLLEESAKVNEKEKSDIRNILETATEQILKDIPKEGMKEIILPDIDEIMLGLAQQLVNNGIYFSKGAIFDIENSNLNGTDIKGIPAEIYSRMLPGLQKALLKTNDTKPLSIFSILQNRNKLFKGLSKIPHIWEEIFFRFIPACLSIVAMSIPAISFLTIPLSLIFFAVCQNQFIKAHNISKWISQSNQKFTTAQIITATLFNIFPSKELKEKFELFAKQEKVKQATTQRTLPALLLSVPYIYSMLFMPNIPVIILATIIGAAIHKFFNSIFEYKLNIFNNGFQSYTPDTFNIEQIENIDLSDKTNLQLVKTFLSSDIYNTASGIKIINKIDFSNDAELELVSEIRFINNEILSQILQKINFGNTKHLSLLLKLLSGAGYLVSFQNIFSQIIKNIDLNDSNILGDFYQFIKNNSHYLDENNILSFIEKLDLNRDEHIKLLELFVQNNSTNVDLVFNILINKKINLNDERYNKFFQIIIDKILSKYSTYKDAKKYFKSNILNLPANTNQGKYAFSKLINLLHRDLIAHQNKYLKMVNGHIVLRVNENGADPIFVEIKNFAQDMSANRDLFDNELKAKFDELIKDVVFFEKMETHTSRKIYSRKHKVVDSLTNNVTIEEFCKEKGFSLIRQTPGIFFDSRRYTFTNILNLLSQKVLNLKANQHYSTYIMTRDTIDAENLNDINKKFDIYMKLLDENLYVLNKFGEIVDFSSQFDDVVYHINLMINYLEQINPSAASSFRKILKNLLDDIQNNRTTLSEQRNVIEYTSANNLLNGVTTIGTLINRIHQHANFSFVTRIMGTIENYEDAGHNVLISKNDNLISVYNLSTTNLNPQILRFLSELVDNPDFSTDIRSPIFIKDNIFLWVAQLGAHSVRILADFSEDSKSILVDFHERFIDEGSNIRLKILSQILTKIGFNVKLANEQFANGTTLPVGIIATTDKNNGITNTTDFNNLLKQAAVLFNNAASLNKSLHNNRIQIRENVNVAKLEIMDIYSRFFAVGLLKDNSITTSFNSRRNFNKILKSLDLPLVPIREQGFWTFLKMGFLRIPIKTYGQKTIDNYINKPIEHGFIQGYLQINSDGVLERNKEYNPLSSVTNKINEILNQIPGNATEMEMLNQGAIISQIPQNNLNLTTVGQIGEYVLKTGYIKLIDDRFIALTILVDGNGITRYSSTELVDISELKDKDFVRINLNSKQLQQIIEAEGYKTTPPETLTTLELLNYRGKLQEEIKQSNINTAYGTLISTPKGNKVKNIFGIVNGKEKSGVFTDKFACPENVGTAAQYPISLFTSGSYASHAGIVLREYGKTAIVVNDSRISNGKMTIKFYQPQGNVQKQNNLEVQKIEETEIELQPKDIILADLQNNKLLLFPNKQFKKGRGNMLFELQQYIDNKDIAKIKQFLNKYKGNNLIDQIIEYIHYQSENNSWLNEVLPESLQTQQKQEISQTEKPLRQIAKKIIHITNYIKHIGTNNVYKFGERESLDDTKVGTKSANQSKLFLLLEQLKKDTGIENVAVPNGMVIGYDILEKLLGKEYIELYQQLETVITGDFYDDDEKFVYVQDIIAKIEYLIDNIPEEEIINYIGKENLEIFKNKLTIVRSSGVGEDSKEYSAAGIAESFGSVAYENIHKAVKNTLLSFLSPRAIDYMIKSANVIKPAVLIEEWLDADKAGIMMSEDSNGNRIIQVINGQGEDIVSGRITPYSFTIDIKTGEKTDGDYTNEKTITKETLEKLTKIMEWLEQVEGVPVDIEFLIKDNIIYIVQVRPITTIGAEKTSVSETSQKKQVSTHVVQDTQDNEMQNLLSTKAHIWEELLYRTIPSIVAMINPMIGIPLFLIMQPIFLIVHTIRHYAYDKTSNFIDLLKQDVRNLSLATIALIIPYAISLTLPLLTPVATVVSSKIISTAASTVTSQVIHYKYNKSVPVEKQLKTHKKSQKVSGADLRQPITSQRDIIARMTELEQNMESMDIDVSKQSLLDLIKVNPLLISMVLETYCRAYGKDESKYILGELLKYMKANGHTNGQKEKLRTDFRGYFGEVYVKYNAVADIDEDGNIIRLQMPSDTTQAGYDLVDPKTGIKIQVKTGEESIVKDHFRKYKQYHIPVFTVSEVKQLMIKNNNPNKNLVFSFDLTKDEVLAFVTEAIEILIALSNDKSLPLDIKKLTLQQIIDICNGATTEGALSKEQIINKLEQIQLSKKEENEDELEEWEKLSIFETLKEKGKEIFRILDFTAPVWEEITFRTVPAIISFALIAIPFSHFITIPLAAIIFIFSQRQFVRAHIITDWLKTKDSGWLNDLPIKDILKTSLLGIFPNKELKQDFKTYSKTYQAKKHLAELIPPTIFLSCIYISVSLLSLTNPILLATVISIIVHLLNNSNVELLETLRPINRNLKIQQTGIDKNFISLVENNGSDIISIYDLSSRVKQLKRHNRHDSIPVNRHIGAIHRNAWLQQQKVVANSVGFSLGLTNISISDNNELKANLIQPISETNNLISWERGYDYFYGNTYIDERVVPVEEYVQTIVSSCILYDKHIFFFLPNNFMDLDSKTKREFDYIQKLLTNTPELSNYFTFVVGAYDFINVNKLSVFQKYFNENKIQKTIKKLLAFPKIFMVDSFVSKIVKFRTSLSIFYNKIFISLFENNQSFTEEELKILNADTETQGYIDIYLDDETKETKRKILEAATNNKLIVLHMFRDISAIQSENISEIYLKITRNLAKYLTNDYGLNDIFPAMGKKEIDYPGHRYGYNFFLEEIIKNALVHGYNGLLDQPIGIAIKLNDNQEVQEISTFTKNIKDLDANPLRLREMEEVRLNGYGLGQQYMSLSYLRSYEEIPEFSNGRFFKVKSVLYDEVDETKKEEFEGFTERIFLAHRRGLIILPENMEIVNTMLQQGKSALNTAWKVATMEAEDSFAKDEEENYTFEQRHQSVAGKQGAKELTDFIEKMQGRTRWLNKLSPKLAEKIVRQASIVKHVIIDYRTIKASGIRQAIELFGTQARLNEEGQISIGIVDDIEEIKDSFTLINTGIKIEGSSIYRIKNSELLMYGAKGQTSVKVAQALNGTKEIKKALQEMGLTQTANTETEGVVMVSGSGMEMNNGLLEIGEIELEGKTPEQIKEYITSALEVKRAIGIMYGQKTIIDLKSLTGSALIKAIENGRARKVITESQYRELQLSKEKILELKGKGIEIYVANNYINGDYNETGISGQIIRENGKTYIYDYFSMEKTELDEITEEKELSKLEDKIINGENLIMIDIDLLKKSFQGSNIIESFTKLGALTGKIKMTMGIGNIGIRDIENVGYNIRFEEIPEISESDIQKLIKATTKEEILNIIGHQNGFSIILTSLKDENVNRFKDLIVERILAKKALTESATAIDGTELEDEKIEIMLGKMLLRQINYTDKETIKEELMSQGQLMKVLEQLKEMDNSQKGTETLEQQILVNTIIQLILLYDGQRVKGNQLQKQTAVGDISTYRSMLAAA